MLDDTRLDGKLLELSRELTMRSLVPGFAIADAFTMKGLDEGGRPGLFAAILLAPGKIVELEVLTVFRQLLTQRLKQLDTRTPAWPIVVQSAPEMDGTSEVPGGREYFNQVKMELVARTERMKQRVSVSQMPVVRLAPEATPSKPVVKQTKAAPAAKAAPRKPAATTVARRTAPARASARTARARR